MKAGRKGMTAMKTTDETSAANRFYAWRKQKIEENPTWRDEYRDWFLGMYLQTYPARTFALTTELFDYFEGKEKNDDQTG